MPVTYNIQASQHIHAWWHNNTYSHNAIKACQYIRAHAAHHAAHTIVHASHAKSPYMYTHAHHACWLHACTPCIITRKHAIRQTMCDSMCMLPHPLIYAPTQLYNMHHIPLQAHPNNHIVHAYIHMTFFPFTLWRTKTIIQYKTYLTSTIQIHTSTKQNKWIAHNLWQRFEFCMFKDMCVTMLQHNVHVMLRMTHHDLGPPAYHASYWCVHAYTLTATLMTHRSWSGQFPDCIILHTHIQKRFVTHPMYYSALIYVAILSYNAHLHRKQFRLINEFHK